MGRTWISVVLTVVGLTAMCPAELVPFIAAADARASLARSYDVIPQFSTHQVDPNDPPMPDTHEWLEAATPSGSIIIAYVVVLELLLAGVAAIACLLVLALAGAIVNLQERPARRPDPIPTHESLPLVTAKRPAV